MHFKKERIKKKENKMKQLSIKVLLLLVLATSCVSKHKMVYFGEKEGVVLDTTLQAYAPTIQKDDLLNINVSATNGEAALPFNLYETPVLGSSSSISAVEPLPYLVNAQGEINFPVLGKIKVTGMTTNALSTLLEEKLTAYLVAPIVNITTANFKITVLGEVKSPGTYKVSNQRITVIEALGLAGDLTINGNRLNVTLVRERDGQRLLIPLDLTSKAIFNSPYYYLAQNDVLYVEPNKAKINSSVVGANTSIIFTAISSLISIIAILF